MKILEYKYDPVGRRILRQVTDNVDTSKSKTQKYYYDGDNIIAELDAENNLTASYTHSPLMPDLHNNGQLATASNPYDKNETFTYDVLGNRITDDQGNYVYDQKLQKLQSDYQYNYFYDNNGNLIRKTPVDVNKPAYKYTYSSTNQLIKIETISGIMGQVTKTVEFKYDVLGRRMQKKITDVAVPEKSFTRRYVYNGANIFAEFDGSNNVLAQYTHSPLRPDDVLAVQITATGASAGLAQASGKYFYLKDLLGSITDITDASGNVVQKYEYSAYGKIYAIRDSSGNDISSSPVVNTSFTYTGREWDSESGMYYYRARYYDPSTGRFLQADPDPGDLQDTLTIVNKYVYAGNNPVMYGDPSGRLFFLIPIIAGIAGSWIGTIVAATVVESLVLTGFSSILTGLIVGAISGAALGAVVGGVLGGVESSLMGISFDQGFSAGFSAGLVAGAVGGGIGGGLGGYSQGLVNAKRFSPDGLLGPKGYEWRGGEKGSWYNPKTSEVLRPDLHHKPPIGPHLDYRDPSGTWWRIFPDGGVAPKNPSITTPAPRIPKL